MEKTHIGTTLIAITLAQLKTKKDAISKLSDDISEAIQDETELETELTDVDSYLTELEEKIAILEEFTCQRLNLYGFTFS